jgi:phosphoglycolate phosphatase-like HAD superfamily hydrolase
MVEKITRSISDGNRILFLDWDLTVTDQHSRGLPIIGEQYWVNDEKYQSVYNALGKCVELGWNVVIISRADEIQLRKFIATLSIAGMIHSIRGADALNLMAIAGESKECGISRWADVKVAIMREIIESSHTMYSNVCFIDDTVANIDAAKSAGIKSSFVCNGTSGELVQIIDRIISYQAVDCIDLSSLASLGKCEKHEKAVLERAVYDIPVHNVPSDHANIIIMYAPKLSIIFRLASIEGAELAKNPRSKRVFATTQKRCDGSIAKSLISEVVDGVIDEVIDGVMDSHFEFMTSGAVLQTCKKLSDLVRIWGFNPILGIDERFVVVM